MLRLLRQRNRELAGGVEDHPRFARNTPALLHFERGRLCSAIVFAAHVEDVGQPVESPALLLVGGCDVLQLFRHLTGPSQIERLDLATREFLQRSVAFGLRSRPFKTQRSTVKQIARLDITRCAELGACRCIELQRGRFPLACPVPMLGNPRRRCGMRLEEGPDRTVQRHGLHLRHGAQRRFEDQVMRKRAVAQNLRGFELTPTIGDVQRVLAQDRGGELGAEILAGERRNLGQLAGCRRQLC
jgi:hypothetical protein